MGAPSSFKQHPRLKDYVSWFEIPAYDILRATAFYKAIYLIEMDVVYNGDFAMAYFPARKGIGGALIAGPGCFPCDTGVLIYLNAGNDLDGILGRVEPSGGRVIMARTLISDAGGYFALFIDSEGNRIALHEGSARTGATKGSPKSSPARTGKKKAAGKKAASAKADRRKAR